MSRFLGIGALIAAVVATALPVGAQQAVAYVDVTYVIGSSDRGKAIQKQLQEEFSSQIERMRSKEEALTNLRSRITNESGTLSQDSLETLRREFQDSQLELQRLTQDVEREVQKRQTALFNVLEKEVLDLLEAIRREKGLGMVFAKGASGLVAADPALDLTEDLMRRVNASR